MSSEVTADQLLSAIKNRRTYYALNKELTVSKERIEELVKQATLHTPSSFNSQTNRVLVLFGEEHNRLWDFTTEILKKIVPEDSWEATAQRMAGFRGAAGSILFFHDRDGVAALQSNFAQYADKFPHWAHQSAGMQEFLLWSLLELEGLGANLQHYNPLIDEKVAETWKIPANWKLDAQLVFGGRAGEPGTKTFVPIEERVKVAGA